MTPAAHGIVMAASRAVAPALALLGLTLCACGTGDRATARRESAEATHAADASATEPPTTDTAATLVWFAQRAAAIERDTARLQQTQRTISLGAGAIGLLRSWRVGPVWRRLRVEGQGEGFRTTDDYWFDHGVLLGARLELHRGDARPAVDEIWFRTNALYRWTDAAGRSLNPDARSTQFAVQMLLARLDTLVTYLNDSSPRRARR
jgi:hypothetical protein